MRQMHPESDVGGQLAVNFRRARRKRGPCRMALVDKRFPNQTSASTTTHTLTFKCAFTRSKVLAISTITILKIILDAGIPNVPISSFLTRYRALRQQSLYLSTKH